MPIRITLRTPRVPRSTDAPAKGAHHRDRLRIVSRSRGVLRPRAAALLLIARRLHGLAAQPSGRSARGERVLRRRLVVLLASLLGGRARRPPGRDAWRRGCPPPRRSASRASLRRTAALGLPLHACTLAPGARDGFARDSHCDLLASQYLFWSDASMTAEHHVAAPVRAQSWGPRAPGTGTGAVSADRAGTPGVPCRGTSQPARRPGSPRSAS